MLTYFMVSRTCSGLHDDVCDSSIQGRKKLKIDTEITQQQCHIAREVIPKTLTLTLDVWEIQLSRQNGGQSLRFYLSLLFIAKQFRVNSNLHPKRFDKDAHTYVQGF